MTDTTQEELHYANRDILALGQLYHGILLRV
jgi:hypothetical protein